MSFTSFGLNKKIIQAVTELGYLNPTAIQQQAIPLISSGHDLMARAKTGTGKTAAFALPIIELLSKSPNETEDARVLVLSPTRELAKQLKRNFDQFSKFTHLSVGLAYGGASSKQQLIELKRGVDIIIATPGRLLDFVRSSELCLGNVECLVFDEADRMLDLGFKDEIESLLANIPEKRQTLLFSATFDDNIYKISKKLLNKAKIIEIDENNTTAVGIEELIYNVDSKRKAELTSYLIGKNNWQQVLIFTRTKLAADELAKEMKKDGLLTESLHGDKSQGRREKILEDFKSGNIRALVATDVASRGIDIDGLDYVINYELPHQAEDYVHRVGRTGRAGRTGLAISLLSPSEEWLLKAIEKLLDKSLIQQWYPGFEPDLSLNDDPKNNNTSKSKKRARQKALQSNRKANRPTERKARRKRT